jgi:hypothetical protein
MQLPLTRPLPWLHEQPRGLLLALQLLELPAGVEGP